MNITVKELEALTPDSFILYDIRSDTERLYGVIDGSEPISTDKLLCCPPQDKSRKLIVCCARGKFSIDTANRRRDMGYDAYSLEGGYAAWLLNRMQKEQAE